MGGEIKMELYRIESCRSIKGCPRSVGHINLLQEKVINIFDETDFSGKRQKQLGENAKQHHIFKVGLAGCANSCSQPQIKDFALIAKAIPVINHDLCTLCGQCIITCKEQGLTNEKGQLNLNENNCLGCGDCWRVCSSKAIVPGEVTWRLLLGGKLGRHPQLAKEIKEVTLEEALVHLRKAIEIVLNSSTPKERFAQMLVKENISFS